MHARRLRFHRILSRFRSRLYPLRFAVASKLRHIINSHHVMAVQWHPAICTRSAIPTSLRERRDFRSLQTSYLKKMNDLLEGACEELTRIMKITANDITTVSVLSQAIHPRSLNLKFLNLPGIGISRW